jgi:hypothetical protein
LLLVSIHDPVAGAPTGNIIDMNLVAMAMPAIPETSLYSEVGKQISLNNPSRG